MRKSSKYRNYLKGEKSSIQDGYFSIWKDEILIAEITTMITFSFKGLAIIVLITGRDMYSVRVIGLLRPSLVFSVQRMG